MKHYVLTRSAYGPEWPVEANARRLALTRAVTLPTMAAQTTREWTWVVALHPGDALLAERTAAFAAVAPRFIPLLWSQPEQLENVGWAPHRQSTPSRAELVAAAAYRAPWRSVMEPGEQVLQTRLDDDDGLARDALGRYQHVARRLKGRQVLMLPRGLRVYGTRFQLVRHNSNAMHTLMTPPGDDLCVYDYGHTKCARVGKVRVVDQRLGWLWCRHRDTLSGWRGTVADLTPFIRSLFPVDWATVEAAA